MSDDVQTVLIISVAAVVSLQMILENNCSLKWWGGHLSKREARDYPQAEHFMPQQSVSPPAPQ